MSTWNKRPFKRLRSKLRASQKQAAATRIPFGGVVLDVKTVKNHRYLQSKGLPHSKAAADVHLPGRRRRASGASWGLGVLAAICSAAMARLRRRRRAAA